MSERGAFEGKTGQRHLRAHPGSNLGVHLSPLRARTFRGVVVGSSAGGMDALLVMLGQIPADFPIPILVASHLHRSDDGRFADYLDAVVELPVSEAADKQPIEAPHVFISPANYHLLVEGHGALALSTDAKVNWSRPSIDVLFESAARAWGEGAICVVLSGANDDGAEGAHSVKSHGGVAIAQDPNTAEYPVMPEAAIERAGIELVLAPATIGDLLVQIARRKSDSQEGTDNE